MILRIGFCVFLVALNLLAAGGHASASALVPAAVTSESPDAGVAFWGRAAEPAARAASLAAAIVRVALRYVGRPYQWSGIGAPGARGFDCSGLVFRVFGVLGLTVPHSSSEQYREGTAVPAASLGPGDLVFFHTYTSGPSHVGIYLGARRFIHASVSRGVVVSSMDEPHYRARYLGARRY